MSRPQTRAPAAGRAARTLERLRRRLRCRVPIAGGLVRRWAARRAAEHARRGEAWIVSLLVEACDVADPAVSEAAVGAIRGLSEPSQLEALCAAALRAPQSVAADVCRGTGARPADSEDACLFLFVTGQLDAYFAEDFEFQNLRLAYDRASPEVRDLVLRVVRSGDRRCLGFLGSRKKLSECTDREISLALQSYLRHEDWPRLFQAFLELPLRYGLHILRRLRACGWEPEDAEARSLLRQALADTRSQAIPEAVRPLSPGTFFERALEEGRRGPLSRLEPEELVARLRPAAPARGVSIVAALATKVSPDSAAAREALRSPHWLVRLAAHVTGLSTDLVRDEVGDANHWVRSLAPVRSVLELWPGRATPWHLQALASAPPAAWEGGLGAARKVLRLLIARRVTAGTFEDLVVEADAFAGEFEPISDVEWDVAPPSEPARPTPDGPSSGRTV